ncbi:hypothetical protein Hanom_Chr10g00906861 [Helianthus anomalus]
MNSLRPQGLFLANHFDDVDTLLFKIIHYGRQTLFSSILLYSPSHVIALNQSFGLFVSSIASTLMSSHHQISSFSALIQSTYRPPPLISF